MAGTTQIAYRLSASSVLAANCPDMAMSRNAVERLRSTACRGRCVSCRVCLGCCHSHTPYRAAFVYNTGDHLHRATLRRNFQRPTSNVEARAKTIMNKENFVRRVQRMEIEVRSVAENGIPGHHSLGPAQQPPVYYPGHSPISVAPIDLVSSGFPFYHPQPGIRVLFGCRSCRRA